MMVLAAGCGAPAPLAKSVLVITIDTLRADHVGAYGAPGARTPTLDMLAREGARFDRAWAPAPITLPSHASLFTGRYPPGHGARHNGMAVEQSVPTLATLFKAAGFATAAFVSAFPLDRRFGLARGFDVYDDTLPRAADGRPLNERPGADTVDRALAWLQLHRDERFFVWVHLFEPHAPYGNPRAEAAVQTRYDDEIAVADREAGRLLAALGPAVSSTLVVAAADHGEAFGEHGEIGHSMFVYDTTLRVPLMLRGPGVPPGVVVREDVSLVDVAPTAVALTGIASMQADGLSLAGVVAGQPLAERQLYAESFAPLLDFGWASLRAVRDGRWKYIAAPQPELYEIEQDHVEGTNRLREAPQEAARLDARVASWSGAELAGDGPVGAEASARLRSLGYLGGASAGAPVGPRPDPKDRIAIASQMATVTSGEVSGARLIATLEAVLRDDPQNPQAHLRLGFAEVERDRCAQAEPHFIAALRAGVPSADAGLGLATCLGRRGDLKGAAGALEAARRAEPGNPVVTANIGILALREGRLADAIRELRAALLVEPRLQEARFVLARALARSGDRQGAASEASNLLNQMTFDAPQRAEVERFLLAVK